MHRKKIANVMLGILLILMLVKVTAPGAGADDSWRRVADMPTPRSCLTAVVVDGKIYAIGGHGFNGIKDYWLATVEEYDPATDTWTSRADMPTARQWLAATAMDGKIYAIGGWGSPDGHLRTVEEYDPATDTWRSRAPMPTARSSLAAATLNGKIYALGGEDPDLRTVEEYDPVTDTWCSRAPMPTARQHLAAAVVGGRLYVLGGCNRNVGCLATVEEYDPATDTWTSRADMPTARQWLAAVAVGGRIYAIGGEGGSQVVEEYVPFNYEEVPTVTVVSPNGGEYWSGTHTITWTAKDPQADPLTYMVYYSPNGGQTWTKLATDLTEPSYLWNTTMVEDGMNCLIKVVASDGKHIGVDVSDAPFEITNESTNTAPTVLVLWPNGGERVHGMFEIQWSANDPEGDFLTFTISYSLNGGDTWTQIASKVTETSYVWDTSEISVGPTYLIKVEASNGILRAEDCSDAPFTVEWEVPTETNSKGLFIPSFRMVEALGALLVLLGSGKRQRGRKML